VSLPFETLILNIHRERSIRRSQNRNIKSRLECPNLLNGNNPQKDLVGEMLSVKFPEVEGKGIYDGAVAAEIQSLSWTEARETLLKHEFRIKKETTWK